MKFLTILAVLTAFIATSFADAIWSQRACVIGPKDCVHGGPIYVKDGYVWRKIAGSAAKVTFNYDGDMYVINLQGGVYRRYGAGGWDYMGSVPGQVWDIDAHSAVLGPIVSTTSGVYKRSVAGQWVVAVSVGDLRAISCRGYDIYGIKNLSGSVAKYANGSLGGLYAPPSGTNAFYDISVNNENVYVSYQGPPYAPLGMIFKLDNFTSQWSTTVNPATWFDVSLYQSDEGYDQAILKSSYDNNIWWCVQLQGTNMYGAGGPANALDVAVGDGSYDIMCAPSKITSLDALSEKRDSVVTK